MTDKPGCAMCEGREHLRVVLPRRGWGAAGQSYWPAEVRCMKCCRKTNGQYKLVREVTASR